MKRLAYLAWLARRAGRTLWEAVVVEERSLPRRRRYWAAQVERARTRDVNDRARLRLGFVLAQLAGIEVDSGMLESAAALYQEAFTALQQERPGGNSVDLTTAGAQLGGALWLDRS